MVPEQQDEFHAAKAHVLSKLNAKSRPQLVGLEKERQELFRMMQSVVVDKEGNSCIIMGPRSSGKTTLVQSVIESLYSEYGDEAFILINLSGYSQSDDKMAVREISRQLDSQLAKTSRSTGISYETLEKKRINDTLVALLNVLEPEQEDIDDAEPRGTTSVIFVLEEVDRFASNNKQTLLYNLLDIAQSSSIGIAVVGVTTRMNAREMMEKRVRSRFSQRVFSVKRPTSLENFWKICRSNLVVDYESEFSRAWNDDIEKIYNAPESPLAALVEQTYLSTKDLRQFNNRLMYTIAHADPLPSLENITKYEKEQGPADSQSFLQGLAELELALLISAARAEVKLESDTINFNLVYDEYRLRSNQLRQERIAMMKDVGTSVAYRIWSKGVARSAWERLETMGLILSLNNYADIKKGTASVRDELKMVKVDVTLLELADLIGRSHFLYSWTRI